MAVNSNQSPPALDWQNFSALPPASLRSKGKEVISWARSGAWLSPSPSSGHSGGSATHSPWVIPSAISHSSVAGHWLSSVQPLQTRGLPEQICPATSQSFRVEQVSTHTRSEHA